MCDGLTDFGHDVDDDADDNDNAPISVAAAAPYVHATATLEHYAQAMIAGPVLAATLATIPVAAAAPTSHATLEPRAPAVLAEPVLAATITFSLTEAAPKVHATATMVLGTREPLIKQ